MLTELSCLITALAPTAAVDAMDFTLKQRRSTILKSSKFLFIGC